MIAFAKTLVLMLLANSTVFNTFAFNEVEILGKWYTLATMKLKKPIILECMQIQVTSGENNTYAISSSVVCHGCKIKPFKAEITDSMIRNIVVDDILQPGYFTISRLNDGTEMIIYHTLRQEYFLLSRITTMSKELIELLKNYTRQGWKVHTLLHEGCE